MKNAKPSAPETATLDNRPAPYPFTTWDEYHDDQRSIDEERWEFEAMCIATQTLTDAINKLDEEEGYATKVAFMFCGREVLYMVDGADIVNEWRTVDGETWHDLISHVLEEYEL